ncbi:MAG: DUF6531 domain-containing protein [Pseudomonadota bacterium]
MTAIYDYVCKSPYVAVGISCQLTPPKPDICQSTPHPIHIASGNKFLSETIYRGSGAFPLELTLQYNSTDASPIVPRLPGGLIPAPSMGIDSRNRNYELLCVSRPNDVSYKKYICPVTDILYTLTNAITAPGVGWQHIGHRGVTVLPDGLTITIARPDGKGYLFNLKNGVWTPDADISAKLVKLVDGTGATNGWEYTSANAEVESYDRLGKLLTVTNRVGLKHIYAYDTIGRISTITDSFNRQLTLTYDAANRLSTMIDPANQAYSYTYDGRSNLTSVIFPDSKVKTYLYENVSFPHALTAIVDENGKQYMNYHYDGRGRAVSEEHVGNINHYQLALSLDRTSTTLTDPLGTVRTTTFASVLGVDKMVGQTQPGGAGCGASSNAITYDVNGNIATRTDFNNVVTKYTYDLTRNLETSRTEAFGKPEAKTTSTTWHATYRLPLKIAEPLRLTTMTYDAKGNVLTRTVQATTDTTGALAFTATLTGTARTTTYTYNAVGQVLTVNGPRTDVTDVTTYTYDPVNGNLLTITNAANQVTTLSNYDANGRVGKIVDANGLTTDLTYAPRGWLLSRMVTGSGIAEATGYQYDNVGQLKKVTLPDNAVINYTYDDAHRLTDVADSLGNKIHYTLDAMGNRTKEEVKDTAGNLARQTSRVFDALNRLQQVTGGAQ